MAIVAQRKIEGMRSAKESRLLRALTISFELKGLNHDSSPALLLALAQLDPQTCLFPARVIPSMQHIPKQEVRCSRNKDRGYKNVIGILCSLREREPKTGP